MAQFRLSLQDRKGIKKIVINAKSITEVESKYRDEVVLNVERLAIRSSIKSSDIEYLFKELSIMLQSGLTLLDSLYAIDSFTDKSSVKELTRDIISTLNNGYSIASIFEAYSSKFTKLISLYISFGEKSGNLDIAIELLNKNLDMLNYQNSKIKKVILYPLFTLIFTILSFISIVLYLIPKFHTIFSRNGADLPFATESMIFIYEFLNNYGIFLMLILTTLIIILRELYSKNLDIEYLFDKFLLRIYLIKDIIFIVSALRFFTILKHLDSIGEKLIDSIEYSSLVVDNRYLNRVFFSIKADLKSGKSFSKALRDTSLFDDFTVRIMNSYENSGDLSKGYDSVTQYLESRLKTKIDIFSSFIEPLLILFAALLILWISLAIFLPMWSIDSFAI